MMLGVTKQPFDEVRAELMLYNLCTDCKGRYDAHEGVLSEMLEVSCLSVSLEF